MRREKVDEFEKLTAQLDSLYQEISTLVKKSPNDAINNFKLGFVNKTLLRCNEFLGEEYRPFLEFDSFSIDDMPSNSDVTFIVSQYIESAEKFRADNITWSGVRWQWKLDDDGGEPIDTSAPRKLRSK